MNTSYLNKLEYNEIQKNLSNYCHTFEGKNMALSLCPSNNAKTVHSALLQTAQSVNVIKSFGNIPLSEIPDISISLKSLNSGMTLSINSILEIANILIIAKDLKNYFSQDNIEKDNFNSIEPYFSMLYYNDRIINKISDCIIDKTTIADKASKSLQSIRNKKRNLEQSIKDKLNLFIHSSANSKYIQEPVVTIKNDRYVIPVKSEYRSSIKGFVHDISSSGSTVFIEPLAVFEMNNEINNLNIEESIEIEKILLELSNLLRPYTSELETNIQAITNLDFIFAKAKYSIAINAITPTINKNKEINLISARHPLIDENKVIPISLNLGSNFSTLVITGPNTGGKTVTLKTVGLLVAMACSGLNIPAKEGSSIYVFDNIFADIGDNQSIANSLSTFSSHMINIVDITKCATAESLILVDELGSGTDPLEGANLAISILEYFNKLGTLTVSTTHYQELKKYALTTNGFENASVEFDTENLKPTYKLLVGIPGKSNAFEISKKLGLDKNIIDRATSGLTSQEIKFEDLLKNIYENKVQIEKEKEEIEKNLTQITTLRKKLERDDSKLKEQENNIIKNAKTEARNILLNAKEEANNIISEMNTFLSNASSSTELNKLRNRLNDDIKETLVSNFNQKSSSNSITPDEAQPGLKVFVTTFNQIGEIISHISKSNEVQVQIGSMKTNVNIKFLEKANQKTPKPSSSNSYTKHISKSKTATTEINVIGLNVEEAIFAVDKFLDDCYLSKIKTVRIVHGKGTGKLRTGIQAFLKKHPHVQSYRIGSFGEGEMGVTIVELK